MAVSLASPFWFRGMGLKEMSRRLKKLCHLLLPTLPGAAKTVVPTLKPFFRNISMASMVGCRPHWSASTNNSACRLDAARNNPFRRGSLGACCNHTIRPTYGCSHPYYDKNQASILRTTCWCTLPSSGRPTDHGSDGQCPVPPTSLRRLVRPRLGKDLWPIPGAPRSHRSMQGARRP